MTNRTNEEYRLQRLHEVCFNDLTGMRFNNLTVLGVSHKVGKLYYWKCRCECGNETVVAGGAITSGHTKSCGCLHKGAGIKDLVGQRFGKLVVTEFAYVKNRKSFWKCLCDCGNEKIICSSNLRHGNTKSCGCLKHEVKTKAVSENLVGRKFSFLTVIEYTGHSIWKCRCDCGGEKMVRTSDLTRGFVTSCGCISKNFAGSIFENEIKDYIHTLNPKLKIEKSKILDGKEIDIYIPEIKLGIEYNGSPFHASSGGIFCNLDKYYHRDKFLLARLKGIRLLTIFDIDYENNKFMILDLIKSIVLGNENHQIPHSPIIYTNNDYDDGSWLKDYGYIEICQEEPNSFMYKDKYLVYRCGMTKWKLDNTEITN